MNIKKTLSVKERALNDYKQGAMTTESIAAKYGIAPATLTVWASHSSTPLRRRGRRKLDAPTPMHLKIIELAKTMGYNQIGLKFGMRKQSIHRIVKRWRDWTPSITYHPGDTVAWKGKAYEVLAVGATDLTLRDSNGKLSVKFPISGESPLQVIHTAK
jgi:hypothetical protein